MELLLKIVHIIMIACAVFHFVCIIAYSLEIKEAVKKLDKSYMLNEKIYITMLINDCKSRRFSSILFFCLLTAAIFL